MAENKWANNNDSWEVSTEIGDYLGVDASGNPSPIDDAKNHFSPLDFSSNNHAFSNIGQQAKGVLNGVTTMADSNQYLNLGTAVLNSVSNASYDIVRMVFEEFTKTQEITISSLMQEIAPYAADFKTAGKALGSTAKKYADKFLNINEWLGSFVSDVMNNPAVVEAISGLSVVETYAATLNTASEVINGVEKVIQVINPILPIVRMVSNLALAWWSGGSTAAEESTNIMNDTQKILLQLSSVAMFYIKKYAYGIKIKVPKILVSTLNAFSVKNAVGNFDMNNNWAVLSSTLFNDDYYNTAMMENSKSNTRGTAWLKVTEELYTDSINWTKEQIKQASTLGWQSKNPDSWWSKYKSAFVTSYMSKAIEEAKANVYSTSYESFDTYIDKIKNSDYGQNVNSSSSKETLVTTAVNTWNGIVKISDIIHKSITGVK